MNRENLVKARKYAKNSVWAVGLISYLVLCWYGLFLVCREAWRAATGGR